MGIKFRLRSYCLYHSYNSITIRYLTIKKLWNNFWEIKSVTILTSYRQNHKFNISSVYIACALSFLTSTNEDDINKAYPESKHKDDN